MTDRFAVIEQSPLSVWVREDLWAFPSILVLHAFGMAAAAGVGAALSLRVLGVARGARLEAFARFLPVMWAGFGLALVSGVLLLAGYPAKALTNPVFGLKMLLLLGALALTAVLGARVLPRPDDPPSWGRWAAAGVLACWAGVIVTGRLLAYTHSVLMVS